ncbi:hypothetical protein SETIT_8G148700v2 [Setaria italica]|uniref:Knottin scorpion toxin-like domain-containing protein n=1 Tax=Setaria italica TaxID=4555 RepID=A0A368S7U6_SETIT|nr:hypothetical protein SETIT_8G148700v2 [Setaria italica]
MALLRSSKIRIMSLTTAVVLVLVITSSTFPSCQAGEIIKGHGSPSLLSVTCYTYRFCDAKGCESHCEHKGKKKGSCRTDGVDPQQCCCED